MSRLAFTIVVLTLNSLTGTQPAVKENGKEKFWIFLKVSEIWKHWV